MSEQLTVWCRVLYEPLAAEIAERVRSIDGVYAEIRSELDSYGAPCFTVYVATASR